MTNPLCSLFYSLFTGGLYIFAFFSSAMGVYIHRLKRTICAWYFPQREQVSFPYSVYDFSSVQGKGLKSSPAIYCVY